MKRLRRAALLLLGACCFVAAAAQAAMLVIEADPPRATLVDEARLEVRGHIALPRTPQGAPRFSPDGRYAYLGTPDGWITRLDLDALRIAGEARVGQVLASFALSSDGQWLLAGNEAPATLVMLDAELRPVKTFAATTADGKRSSRVGTVADAAPRTSFVVALRDIPELWEISYNPRAEDIYAGLVHDFRMGEGVPVRGFHNARRSMLAEPLGNLFFDAEHTHVVGSAEGSPALAQVVNLDVRRRIASVALVGRPVLASGVGFASGGTTVLAVPNAEIGALDLIDMRSWKLARTIALPGPGAWLVSHASAPHLWADSHGGATWTAIDKATFTVGATLRLPGPAVAPLAFTRDGRQLLACISGTPGLLIAYDEQTAKEIKRLPLGTTPAHCTLAPAPR